MSRVKRISIYRRVFFLLFLSVLTVVCMKSAYATYAGTGGTCSGGAPINFSTSCNIASSGNQKVYHLTFKGVAVNPPDTSSTLKIVSSFLAMGSYTQMQPTTSNAFSIDVNGGTMGQTFSFVYNYQVNNGAIVQCQTQTFNVSSCQ